jgi:hypothetical protein
MPEQPRPDPDETPTASAARAAAFGLDLMECDGVIEASEQVYRAVVELATLLKLHGAGPDIIGGFIGGTFSSGLADVIADG